MSFSGLSGALRMVVFNIDMQPLGSGYLWVRIIIYIQLLIDTVKLSVR